MSSYYQFIGRAVYNTWSLYSRNYDQLKGSKCKAVAVLLLLFTWGNAQAKPEHLESIAWSRNSPWLIADLHTHSKFSDGSLSPGEMVGEAVNGGCDVVALTDHSDMNDKIATASPAYFTELTQLRRQYPELILMGGIEWNIPPYFGREHVNLIVAPEIEASVLSAFREQFDSNRGSSDRELNDSDATAALQWLSNQLTSPDQAVLFYNHPSRKVTVLEESGGDLLQWRADNNLMIGFEGLPGHQRARKNGAYKQHFHTEDRWDPVAAKIGGIWDGLLDQGENVWAALANSDFHNKSMDYLPCTFSRTHIQVPERTVKGVIQGLQAGSFWADHGGILNKLELSVDSSGLDIAAVPGEQIEVDQDASLTVNLLVERGSGSDNSLLTAELITNCLNGIPRLLDAQPVAIGQNTATWAINQVNAGSDGQSCYVRVRVRKQVEQEADLLAYSNPVRIMLRQSGWFGGLQHKIQSAASGLSSGTKPSGGNGKYASVDQSQGIAENLDIPYIILIIAGIVLLILIVLALIYFKRSRLAGQDNQDLGAPESIRYDSKISLCSLIFDQINSKLYVSYGRTYSQIGFANIIGYEVLVNTECIMKIDADDAHSFDARAGEKLRTQLDTLEMEALQGGETRQIDFNILCEHEAQIHSVMVNFYWREGSRRLSSHSFKKSVEDVVFWCGLLESAIRPGINEQMEPQADDIDPFVQADPVAFELKPEPVIQQAGQEHIDLADELTRLAELRAKGFLSEHEFQQAKDKIINSS